MAGKMFSSDFHLRRVRQRGVPFDILVASLDVIPQIHSEIFSEAREFNLPA